MPGFTLFLSGSPQGAVLSWLKAWLSVGLISLDRPGVAVKENTHHI